MNTYVALWNERLPQTQLDLDNDKIEFPKDENIGFKWAHLVQQEILMWISLCCGDTVEYDQVPLDDFKFIINRRGFSKNGCHFKRYLDRNRNRQRIKRRII